MAHPTDLSAAEPEALDDLPRAAWEGEQDRWLDEAMVEAAEGTVVEARPMTHEPEAPKVSGLPDPRRDAGRALAFGILGVVCFGFVFGPVALALGRRARLGFDADPSLGEGRMAHAAITLGKIGLALHLALLASTGPWFIFVMPMIAGAD